MELLISVFLETDHMSEVKESKFLRFAYYAVPILLVFYVLSIGPVAALVLDSNGKMEYPEYVKEIETFYYPLFWVIGKNEFLFVPYIAYVNFCNDSNIPAEY